MNKLLASLDQRVPAKSISFEDNYVLSYDSQLSITSFLKKSIIGINPYYAKLFLREYINKIEQGNEEISDELYELYCDPDILNAVELGPSDTDLLRFYINGLEEEYSSAENESILIKETPKLISGNNTTGLRTWEAALYLANYINRKTNTPYDFKDKTILELGCGTGLVGLALLKNYNSRIAPIKELIMTDGSTVVFDNVKDTLKLNSLEKNMKVHFQQLIWGPDSFTENSDKQVDVILGADITYDSTVVESLCISIKDFFVHRGTNLAVIAATVRNIDTILAWELELNNYFNGNWRITSKVDKPEHINSTCYFKPGTQEIRIYEIVNN
ncbi:uncharacterized protein SPAPADRAFT_136189 [Spathaspora passalidarum NRRL Y-27907]|uniref:Uncharacterized protein n=1 Tax=Spathaspora passalidarum (strain NRRL Y-27907 / 11-Y1) TaxID=619300 RepID=G3AKL3_SPAPN|nr:uncharacterized protein SPAPADRAFT_136189 [Spathaspora passalidarum NRRL Y-27907]EGW33618.1 hypothetical protein SPAPADRAFT_136189 [Spathaspora passalidarum NRRL Y-27907]